MSKTIDLTPTWTAVMPAIIAVLEDGTADGKQLARAELLRLAAEVDKANATQE